MIYSSKDKIYSYDSKTQSPSEIIDNSNAIKGLFTNITITSFPRRVNHRRHDRKDASLIVSDDEDRSIGANLSDDDLDLSSSCETLSSRTSFSQNSSEDDSDKLNHSLRLRSASESSKASESENGFSNTDLFESSNETFSSQST